MGLEIKLGSQATIQLNLASMYLKHQINRSP